MFLKVPDIIIIIFGENNVLRTKNIYILGCPLNGPKN